MAETTGSNLSSVPTSEVSTANQVVRGTNAPVAHATAALRRHFLRLRRLQLDEHDLLPDDPGKRHRDDRNEHADGAQDSGRLC